MLMCGANIFTGFCDSLGQTYAPRWYVGTPWIEAALVALLFMLAVLLSVKYLSPHRALRHTRRRMMAAVYEILLYRGSPRKVVAAELKLIVGNLVLLILMTPSLAVAGLLFAAMYGTLAARYGYAPAEIGQDLVVRCQGRPGDDGPVADRRILADEDAGIEATAYVVADGDGTTWSRLKPHRPGVFGLRLGDEAAERVWLNVASPSRPAMPVHRVGILDVTIGYPPGSWWGKPWGWVVYFSFVCLVLAVPLARMLKVTL